MPELCYFIQTNTVIPTDEEQKMMSYPRPTIGQCVCAPEFVSHSNQATMNNRRRSILKRHWSGAPIPGGLRKARSPPKSGASTAETPRRSKLKKSVTFAEITPQRSTAGCRSDKSPMSPIRTWQRGSDDCQHCHISNRAA